MKLRLSQDKEINKMYKKNYSYSRFDTISFQLNLYAVSAGNSENFKNYGKSYI